MADRQAGAGWTVAQAEGAGGGTRAGSAAPQAGPDCAVTAENSPITVPVLANDSTPGGGPLTLTSVSDPSSGAVALNPDGTLTVTPGQPGLQTFRYQASDGEGASATGEVVVLVNPLDRQLDQPLSGTIDDQQLARVARACAGATALDVVTLEGARLAVPAPEPGQQVRVLTEPGQRIALQDGAFARATYVVVEGGLLVLTEDGRMVYLADFERSAAADDPVLLSVAGGPPVGGDLLMANLQPLVAPAVGAGTIGRLPPPDAGSEHGGGAGFSPYDPGALPPGLGPLGPLGPTELAFGSEFLIEGSGDELFSDGEPPEPPPPPPPPPLDNQPPTITATPSIVRAPGEITVTPEFGSAGPLPELAEGRAVPAASINGVDPANLRIGPGGDAAIVFNDEIATFQNTIGVYLIGGDGTIVAPRIVFQQVEHADALPDGGTKRPGGGPLRSGDQVQLSDLYDAADLEPGTQFGLFMVANGFRLNGALEGELRFLTPGGDPATVQDLGAPALFVTDAGGTRQVAGDIFHTADPTPGSPLENPLNTGGGGQTISGLQPDRTGLTVGFEDKRLGDGDADFNDVLIDVELAPTARVVFAGGDIEVAADAVVDDPDDGSLSRAVVEIVGGAQPGDVLLLGAPLGGTGVTLTAEATRLVLEGTAPIETYADLLRSITLDPALVQGVREVGLTLTDARGATGDTFVVDLDLSGTNAQFGTDGDDELIGDPLVDDALSGRGGNDRLFGDSGNDFLSGGPGDDRLEGGEGDDVLWGGPGRDTLIGGPGADEHRYQALADRGDVIEGFDVTEGDTLNFTDLFGGGADPGAIDDFVRFDPLVSDVRVSVDLDGAGGGFAFVPYLTLTDPTGVTTAQDAVNNGALVV